MSGLVSADSQPPFDALATSLAQMAEALAVAHAQTNALVRAGDPVRWREASLVWPLFTASLMKKPKG